MDVSMAGEGCEEIKRTDEPTSECPEVVNEPANEKAVTKRFRANTALKHPPFPVLLMRMFNKAKHDAIKRNAIIDRISNTYKIPKHKVGAPVRSALDKLRKSRKIIEIKRGEWLRIAGNMKQLNTLQVSGKITLPRRPSKREGKQEESATTGTSRKSAKKRKTKKRKNRN